ncbi:MAG TPA: putative DNA binding domain-containing protein [Methanocorpusculum sp.]|nr:putative DNA binding domain-containing protein [Methanocorpusculum sp.]
MTPENLGIETEYVEFKESVGQLSRSIEDLAAMLNKHGKGKVIFGVKDNGDVIGIQIGNKTSTKISQGIANGIKPTVIPDIRTETHGEKDLLIVEVSGTNKPYSAHGEYRIRSGNENRKLEPDQLRELMLENSGDLVTSMWATNQDLTFHQLKRFYLDAGLSIADETFAKNTGLLTNSGKYNYLAELLADINNCSIKVVVFAGTDKQEMLIRNEYGYKCLLLAMNQAFIYVQSLNETRIESREGMQRNQTNLFDEDCLSEAWANACLHTKWVHQVPPAIYIFSDRIEVVSYGGLLADYTLDEFFSGISRPINQQLQKIMGQLRIVQQTGHGVTKITARYGKDAFEIGENHITVKIPFAFERQANLQVQSQNLTASEKAVINEIMQNPQVTISIIAAHLSMSISNVNQIIRKLKQKGRINRVGSKKTGMWVIRE